MNNRHHYRSTAVCLLHRAYGQYIGVKKVNVLGEYLKGMKINGRVYSEDFPQIKCRSYKYDAIDRIIVHSGRFHADDVFCAAMLLMCYPDAEILRVSSVDDKYSRDKRTVVADIGFGKYDHHQPDTELRDDGTRYAACGLVFRDHKHILFDGNPDAAVTFERDYIIPVEIADNGGTENPLSRAVSAFNPAWDSDTDSDEMFEKAVLFIQKMIEREIGRHDAELRATEKVKAAFDDSDGSIVILPGYMPWWNVLIDSSAIYVLYPSRDSWTLYAIPVKKGSKIRKKLLPEEWIDSKPAGCIFTHPQLFVAAFRTQPEALNAARQALGK